MVSQSQPILRKTSDPLGKDSRAQLRAPGHSFAADFCAKPVPVSLAALPPEVIVFPADLGDGFLDHHKRFLCPSRIEVSIQDIDYHPSIYQQLNQILFSEYLYDIVQEDHVD